MSRSIATEDEAEKLGRYHVDRGTDVKGESYDLPVRRHQQGKKRASMAGLAMMMVSTSCTDGPGSVGTTDGSVAATTIVSPTTARRATTTSALVTTDSRARLDASDVLLMAAAAGDADGVGAAVRDGADLEARDGSGRTALMLAALHDRTDAARVLVEFGADPDALDQQHDTPWLITGETGSVEMAEILLEAEPDLTIRNRFGGVSIIPASERGHVDYVRRVVATGIDVNHVNDLGWTALLEAVVLGNGSAPYQEIVRILLDSGADPDLADRSGVTAIQHARSSGQTEVARILTNAVGPGDAEARHPGS